MTEWNNSDHRSAISGPSGENEAASADESSLGESAISEAAVVSSPSPSAIGAAFTSADFIGDDSAASPSRRCNSDRTSSIFPPGAISWIPAAQPLPGYGTVIPPHELPAYLFRDGCFAPDVASRIGRALHEASAGMTDPESTLPIAHLSRYLHSLNEASILSNQETIAEGLRTLFESSALGMALGKLVEPNAPGTEISFSTVVDWIRLGNDAAVFPNCYKLTDLSGQERRYVQLLICLNQEWSPAWGGGVQIVSAARRDATAPDRSSYVPPHFNRATAVLMVPDTFVGFSPVRLPAGQGDRVLVYLRVLFLPAHPAELALGSSSDRSDSRTRLLELALRHRLPLPKEGTPPELQPVPAAVAEEWMSYTERDRSVLIRQLLAVEQMYLEMANRSGPVVRGFGHATRLLNGWFHDQWLSEKCDGTFVAEEPAIAVTLVFDTPQTLPQSAEATLSITATACNGTPLQLQHRGTIEDKQSTLRIDSELPFVGQFELMIEFHHSWRPAEAYGSDDPRTLTVRLQAIRIEPALTALAIEQPSAPTPEE